MPMDELLKALQQGDEERVNALACDLFITNEGKCNWVEMNAFERYAPCKIVPLERDSFGWLIGGIKYNDRTFAYG
jgi:hypothetical protein